MLYSFELISIHVLKLDLEIVFVSKITLQSDFLIIKHFNFYLNLNFIENFIKFNKLFLYASDYEGYRVDKCKISKITYIRQTDLICEVATGLLFVEIDCSQHTWLCV